jgi:predicted nucleotidyltransferase
MANDAIRTAADVTLPASIRRVVESAVAAVDPTRVILYGSRARGDARQDSDYDLAFVFSPDRHRQWVRFLADLDDAPVTLLPVDLLDWNEASKSLREKISSEGTTLYERASSGTGAV